MEAVTKITREKMREEIIAHSPVKLIDEVIIRAYSDKASDIHIEPAEHECRVRIRIDGGLVHLGRYKKEIHEEAVARLKVLSSLRTDVRMSPQDGRFKVNITGVALNVRLSVVPSFHGEKCVLRLLPQTSHTHTLENLGFSVRNEEKINQALSATHGMILVVGPTGSGKTTTLYAILQKVSVPEVSAVTLEDPIEYAVGGITQIPIYGNGGHGNGNGNVNGGLTFATALRAVVRQDPDVIMVGEIRDTATAELSIHAALTGHLLLSTLHTNDAVTALPRLIDMGVEPFLIASTVRAIVSQRLIRKVCQKCAIERKITASEIEFLEKCRIQCRIQSRMHCVPDGPVVQKITRGRGCVDCRNSGYSGRTVISEVLLLNEQIGEMIMQKARSDELRKCAIENGMTPLIEDAVDKVFQGKTTIEEIVSAYHR
ncbi:MAG: GspE/PulE family protein [Patescibacteria group bacterium]